MLFSRSTHGLASCLPSSAIALDCHHCYSMVLYIMRPAHATDSIITARGPATASESGTTSSSSPLCHGSMFWRCKYHNHFNNIVIATFLFLFHSIAALVLLVPFLPCRCSPNRTLVRILSKTLAPTQVDAWFLRRVHCPPCAAGESQPDAG